MPLPFLLKYRKEMNIVKAVHKIKDLLTEEQLGRLEGLALQYQRYARIYFKIMAVSSDSKELVIAVWQERSPSDNYLDEAALVERARGLFVPFFEGWELKIGARVYVDSPVMVVTDEWIRERMSRLRVSNKQMVKDLGLAKAEVSALVNGHREMGVRTKGLFYYYFKWLEGSGK